MLSALSGASGLIINSTISGNLPATREVAIPGFSAYGLSTQAMSWVALGRCQALVAGET
jgi:hypothetical protein